MVTFKIQHYNDFHFFDQFFLDYISPKKRLNPHNSDGNFGTKHSLSVSKAGRDTTPTTLD